ncbi:MAG: alanine--tRNA ligase [Cyanobacteria bacterium]|nr:alanine--tRNA ligase [Cyanobacteriota bacterium]
MTVETKPLNTLSGREIRRRFIAYFQEKCGHKHLPSASLIPSNPTVLLTPAGMLPFVPVFMGIEPPPSPPRVVTSQKCARVSGKASDLENVGRTPRHHTFFEMLGNFSFGDYFKREVIRWAWDFVTLELGIPKEMLVVSVFESDMEARDIWRDEIGVPEAAIFFMDAKNNFWGPPGPTGPCGPCSEIYVDLGAHIPVPAGEHPLESDRYIEIWNLVFMELFKDADGKTTPLEKKNIDTGMGLERITMVLQGKNNTFETDLLMPIVKQVSLLCGLDYGKSADADVAMKIVADHARFVAFAMSDGIVASNEGRGYVLRMILRRAVRYAKRYLNLEKPFMAAVIDAVVAEYGEDYPELVVQAPAVKRQVTQEEERFLETLERGLGQLEQLMKAPETQKNKILSGEQVFKLYDTFGFPAELTQDILQENGLTADMDGFEAAMLEQKNQARKARKGAVIVEDQVYSDILDKVGPTRFVGYEALTIDAVVKALIVDGKSVEEVSGTNQAFEAVLDQTSFYAESGGQVGDRGTFSREDGHHGLTVVVNDTVKVGDLFIHRCLFDNGGKLRVGETLLAQVEPDYRHLAAIHHSATHLLHAALKKVLGPEVAQAGSQVTPEAARFDFSFSRGLSPSELQRVEYQINQWVMENTPRELLLMDLESAKQSGAVAMFGEKYGDEVRVIRFGESSQELCGGTHVARLGDIGLVKLLSESSIASGVRRIEMVAGEKALKQVKLMEADIARMASMLKSPPHELPEKLEKLLQDGKKLEKQIESLEFEIAKGQAAQIWNAHDEKAGPLILLLPAESPQRLKQIVDVLLEQHPDAAVFLASDFEGKAHFVCGLGPTWVKQGFKAGDCVKAAAILCGGGGGGKPQMAQAGGKDPSKMNEALERVRENFKVSI